MKCPRVRSRTEFHRKDGPASSYPGERRVRAEPRVAARGARAEKPAPTTPRSSAAKVRRAKSRKSAASKNKKLTAEKRGFPKAVSRRRFVAVRPASPWSATGLWFRRLGGLRRPPGRCGRSGLGRSRRRGGHRGCRFGDPVAAPVRPTRHRRSKGRRRS